jgi:hypothetical protein
VNCGDAGFEECSRGQSSGVVLARSWVKPVKGQAGARIHYERHRPEESTLYRLVQQHALTFFAQVDASLGAGLPKFVRDEFDAFLECGILAHGLLVLRYAQCAHDKRVAFSCKRRGFFPSRSARRMTETAAHLVDHVIPKVPVRQWVFTDPTSPAFSCPA